MGIAVEYADHSGAPQWTSPPNTPWDYTILGRESETPAPDGGVVPLVFRKKFAGHNGVDNWTINGKSFAKTDPIRVRANARYRLRFDNQSDEPHPVQLHRHSFEMSRFADKATAGAERRNRCACHEASEVDFTADNRGPTLFHCHQPLHMDYGSMTMLPHES
jgi:FtsP/CotA-like multicopper oxidase with cupredoxin domain